MPKKQAARIAAEATRAGDTCRGKYTTTCAEVPNRQAVAPRDGATGRAEAGGGGLSLLPAGGFRRHAGQTTIRDPADILNVPSEGGGSQSLCRRRCRGVRLGRAVLTFPSV